MSTRAQIRFATREAGISFDKHPEKIHAQFYKHSDGYPEGLGLDIAKSILDGETLDQLEIEYLDTKRGDLNYIYYIWQSPSKTTWISIFKTGDFWCENCHQPVSQKDVCVFVGEPQKLIEKYEDND